MTDRCDVVVLISGSGSNLQALIDSTTSAGHPARIRAVISNRADAYGLERARQAGIETRVLDHREFDGREAFDQALAALIDSFARTWWSWPASCASSAQASCATTPAAC